MKGKFQRMFLKLSTIVAGLALVLVSTNVNTACTLWVYQPEIPKEAKNLRKF